jgi:hypothetical protein
MLRINQGQADVPIETIIGYVTSPGGLNGETDMRDWMAEKVTQSVFDLNRQTDELRAAARNAIYSSGAQTPNLFDNPT